MFACVVVVVVVEEDDEEHDDLYFRDRMSVYNAVRLGPGDFAAHFFGSSAKAAS